MNASESGAVALLICQDLFFVSKITGTANALGFKIVVEGEVRKATSSEVLSSYDCVIVDLATPGLTVADVMQALPTEDRPRVIAFGSHVLTAQLQSAREAGCDEVMPRSKFSATLPEVLTRHFSG